MMRFLLSLSVVLLIAAINAAPTSRPGADDTTEVPTKNSVPGDTQKEKPGDTQKEKPGDTQKEKPGDTQKEKPGDTQKEKDEDKIDNVNKHNGTGVHLFSVFGDVDGGASDIDKEASFLRDFQQRMIGSLLRLGEKLLRGNRLQGSYHHNTTKIAPQYFPFLGFHDVVSSAKGSSSVLKHPMHIPMSNNTNSTYEVHTGDGTRVEVNRTTSRESGEGFDSIYQYQVIHVVPDKEQEDDYVPVGKDVGRKTPPQLKEESVGERIETEVESVGERIETEVESVGERNKTEVESVGERNKTEVESVGERNKTEVESVGERNKTEVESVGERNKTEEKPDKNVKLLQSVPVEENEV